jgi:ABC-type bacteriocin/lantibiotic exporter with double-glycine peptidase domain
VAQALHLRLLPGTARIGAALSGLVAAGLLAPRFGLAAAVLCCAALASAALLCAPYRYRARDFESAGAPQPAAQARPAQRLRTLGGDALRAIEMGGLATQLSRRQLDLGRSALLYALAPVLALALLAATRLADASLTPALLLLSIPACAAVLPAVRLPLRLARLGRSQWLLDDLPPEVPTAAPSGAVAGGELVAEQLVFGYSRKRPPLLNGVSLTLAAGSITGLTGASGGGKSTLALLLAGLGQPWSGTASLGSVDLAQLTEQERARHVGWVDARPFFTAGSLRANLCQWQVLDPARLRQALDDAGASEIIASRPGGLDCAVEEAGRNFSGGQLQRLAIARALLRAPQLLILDEGSDGLDPALEAQLLIRLRRRGCTVLVISHRAATLAACDRVLHLRAGQLCGGDAVATPSQPEPALHALPDVTLARQPMDPDRQRACLRQLMRLHNLDWRAGAPVAGLAELAARQGVALRAVRMSVGAWWDADPGALLVRQRADGALAVLRRAGAGYVWSPGDDHWQRLAAPPGSTFEADAWTLDQPVPAAHWTLAASCAGLAILQLAGAVGGAGQGLWILPAALLLHARTAVIGARGAARWQVITLRQLQAALARLPRAMFTAMDTQRLHAAMGWAHQRRDLPGGMEGRWPSLPLALWTLAGALALLLAWHGPVAACALAPLVPLLWQGRTVAAWQRAQHAQRRADRLLRALLFNVTRLRACGTADAALERWRTLTFQAARLGTRHDWVGTARRSWEAGCAPAALAALGWHAGTGAPTSAALMLLALAQADSLARAGSAWIGAAASRRDLRRLLRQPAPHATAAASAPWAIAASGLTWRYPGSRTKALSDVTLNVRAGRITALAGASGSGKSTLLRLLLGLDAADAGTVTQHGVDLARTAYIAQGDALALSAPLRWHLTGGAPWPLDAILAALRAACLEEDLARMPMGLQTIVDSGRVATGQMQRILIARALLQDPSLLVLDEATSALPDPMQERILRHVRERGITCLLVSHRASALHAADHVVVLEAGRVRACGTPSQPSVAELIGGIDHAEQGVDVDILVPPRLDQTSPLRPGAVRPQLFRREALARFQGEGHRDAPLLLARARHWPFRLLALVLAAGPR